MMRAYRTLDTRAAAVALVISVSIAARSVPVATLEAGAMPLLTAAAAPPAAPSGPSPANAATAVAISTSLTWVASADASTYDVAFGTTSSPPLVSAGQTATSYTPPAALAYAKKYYWRITARGPGGSTAGPVWSFTTVAAPPAMPRSPSPVDGASEVTTSTVLKWAASTRATSYDVALGTSNPPTVVSTGQTARSYTPAAPLASTTTYYWQITANGAGGATAGPVWSFTTIAAPPAPPSGASPANAATAVAISTSLTWAASTGASTYDVAFGTTSSPPVVSAGQAATLYTPPAALSYATKYYWRIIAKGSGGSTAGPLWSFTTIAPPPPPAAPDVPSGPSPTTGAVGVEPSTALAWAASAGASTYDVAFGTSTPPNVVSTDQSTTTYTPSTALEYATTYYWQITARGAGGSTAGPMWSFTTAAAPVPAPDVPSGPSPANASTDIAPSAALAWVASAGASTYDVAFGASTPPNVVSTDQSTTTYTPSAALAYATTYYWQITAKGAGGSSAGPVWSFTTIAAPPPPTQTLDRLRVMTWNISMGKNLAGTMNVDEQVALMADSGAHIIALQEVTVSSAADLRVQYETRLEALTQRDWTAVWAPDPRPTPSEGNLILTMLPVLSSSIFQYDSAPWDPSWLDTKRAAAQISVSVNGVPVTVFATHLPLDANHRRSHINTMLTWIAGFAGPRIFGGDFNMVAGSTEYATMQGAFADAWTMLAPDDQGFTMDKRSSAGNTPGRIDYWWQEITDTQVRGTEVWVIKTKRSDHHALVVDLDVHAK